MRIGTTFRAGVAALSLALAGCGSGSAPHPLSPYRSQQLAWGGCDGLQIDDATRAKLAGLGSRAACAMMRAPRDYADPAQGDLQVAFIRIAAEAGGAGAEPLLLNPGGPGHDGVSFAIGLADRWKNAGGPFQPVSQAYDLVGFSPRGTWSSTPLLTCQGDEPTPYYGNPATERDPASIAAMVQTGALLTSACAANPLRSFVHSDAIARDMDLYREIHGKDRLHYFGGSYGTWLGMWYASLFPERVGRMLLMAVVDPVEGLEETYLAMSRARQAVLDDVLAVYAAAHPEAFGLGADVARVRSIHRSLSPVVKGLVSDGLDYYHSARAPENVMLLVAAAGLQEILDANPAATEAELPGLVATHRFPPPLEPFQAMARERALALGSGYFLERSRPTGPVTLDSSTAAYYAVSCNDEPRPRSQDDWIAQNDRDAALYPVWGGRWTMWPCFTWGGNVATRPPLSRAAAAGGILLVQTRRDAATSLEGALAALDALPNTRMVEVVGDDYSHGFAPPYGSECVDTPIVNYLLHGDLPVRRLECQGRELPPPQVLITPTVKRLGYSPYAPGTPRW